MTTGKYATTTSVSVDRTQLDIKSALRKYGAESIGILERPGTAVVQAEFRNRRLQFTLPQPDPKDQAFTHRMDQRSHRLKPRTAVQAAAAYEQACRSSWRSLYLVIHATLEAVEAGIVDFDTAFMPYMMLHNGKTVATAMVPALQEHLDNGRQFELTAGGK